MSQVPQLLRLRLILMVALAVSWQPGLLCGLALHGPHHPQKMAKQQIEELEQQWRTATLNSDIAAMDSLLSEDYVGISWTGQVNTKAMQLDRVRTKTFSIVKLDLLDSRVKVVGNVAIVTSLAQLEGSNDNVPFRGMFRYTRVYQRVPSGAWKITNFEATRIPDGTNGLHHARLPEG
jgi:ketosteroid isomerase-like protein